MSILKTSARINTRAQRQAPNINDSKASLTAKPSIVHNTKMIAKTRRNVRKLPPCTVKPDQRENLRECSVYIRNDMIRETRRGPRVNYAALYRGSSLGADKSDRISEKTDKPSDSGSVEPNIAQTITKVPVYRSITDVSNSDKRVSNIEAVYEFQFDANEDPTPKKKPKIRKRNIHKPRKLNQCVNKKFVQNINVIERPTRQVEPQTHTNLVDLEPACSENNYESDHHEQNVGLDHSVPQEELCTNSVYPRPEDIIQQICTDFDEPLEVIPSLNESNPWRVEVPFVKQSPFFETKRHSFMPSYNQEPPKNSSMSFITISDQTLHEKSAIKKTHQTTMHSYMKTSSVRNDLHSESIFDEIHESSPKAQLIPLIHKLSPEDIATFGKSITSPFKKMNDNFERQLDFGTAITSSPTINKNYRRKILGNNLNISNILQPSDNKCHKSRSNATGIENINPNQKQQSVNETENYFGFDNWDEPEQVATDKKNIPQRISMGEIRKVFKNGKKRSPVKKVPESVPVASEMIGEPVEETENVEETLGNTQALTPHLFEDFESSLEGCVRRSYGRLPKRKRLHYQASVSEESAPKIRKRNARTKTENKEAAKWAKQFNSMCEEVDSFDLCVE